MKKLNEYRLDDWRNAAKDNGVEFDDETTVAQLVSSIAEKQGIDLKDKSKHAAKKAVWESLESADDSDSKKSEGKKKESSKTLDKSNKDLEGKTVEELQAIGEKEGVVTKDHNDKDYLIELITSVRAMRARSVEKTQEKSNKRTEKRTKKNGKTKKEVDPEIAFQRFCTNVTSSFKSGIFNRRRPTLDEIEAHLDRSKHGYNLELIEGKTKKEGKHVVIKTKIGKKSFDSDKILIAD